MRNLFLSLVFISLSSSSFSQKDTAKSNLNFLGFNTGYGYCRYSDPTESAKIYVGNYCPFNISWTTVKVKQIDRFSFFYGNSDFNSDDNTSKLKLNSKYFQLTYNFERSIYKKKNVSLYIGGGISGYMSIRGLIYKYTSSNVVDSNNGDLFISTNFSCAAKIKQKENVILLYLYNSIFAYMNQAIFRTGQKDGHFILFPKLNTLAFNADYKIKMNKTLFFDLGYSFYYYQYPRYGNISITKGAHNQFLAGFDFKF